MRSTGADETALYGTHDDRGDEGAGPRRAPPTPTGGGGSTRQGSGTGPDTAGTPTADASDACGSGAAAVWTEQMNEVLQQCRRPVQPGKGLDDLAGLGSVKEEVRMALLLPMRMPHL
ncbi:hypothetical protein GPECTOR_19g344 [Gonium pectorale]|uniref:Uncharacterized protein n=1 Tax=Gonium pectorale TaxID=33097 RepID=A0A150GJB0_GONPE|nr:hypothetical protein GPECTOR_19g344 [Gonium pectorale]|eukprot:KXZ49893.1 hypothetical protein GPECTOR_19g344 [Gonium pectorale]